jgi:hypothetical protein
LERLFVFWINQLVWQFAVFLRKAAVLRNRFHGSLSGSHYKDELQRVYEISHAETAEENTHAHKTVIKLSHNVILRDWHRSQLGREISCAAHQPAWAYTDNAAAPLNRARPQRPAARLRRQAAHQRWGAADRCEYCQAAGAVAQSLKL